MKLISFSYRSNVVPQEADLVVDCRTLRNPYWEPALRHVDGRDPRVQAFVKADGKFETLVDIVDQAVFCGEAKIVACGCYGGRHRSVVMVEALAEKLKARGTAVEVEHRAL